MMRIMLRLILSAVVGMFAASLALSIIDVDRGAGAWLPATGTLMTILLVLVSIGKMFAGNSSAAVKDVEAADRDGRVFLAKILDVRATGSTLNDNPFCEIRVIAQPRNRPAYETTFRALINLGRLPSYQRGAIVVVAQPDADRPEIALLENPPLHWQRLAETDERLRALDSAPEWTLPPAKGRDRNGLLRIPAVLLLVVFLLGAGIRIWPVREEALAAVQGRTPESASAGGTMIDGSDGDDEDDEPLLFTPEQAQRVANDLVALSGVTQFTDVHLMPHYAVADGLTTPDAVTTDTWNWRDGKAEHDGAELIQPDAADLPNLLFDITTVNWSLVQGMVDQLPGLTGIENVDPSVYVRRAVSDRVGTPVEFSLSTSDDYYSAWITFDANGQVAEMSGGHPDSPAAQWEAANG
jgi:hypothetical protein